jgi:hypothetical protein
MAPKDHVHPDVLLLIEHPATLAAWRAARERIRLSGHPTCEGDDDATDDRTDDAAATTTTTDDKGDTSDDDASDDKDTAAEPDWKRQARRHEREAKAARKREAELAAKLKEREDADKSEQEKAIEAARAEAAQEVTTKYEAERRADRIENAVTKLSLKGFKGKDKDGNEVTFKFADPDDAQLRLDRALRNEDLSYDDIYNDGKVQTAALTAFLTELLEEHPRLRADNGNGTPPPVVDMDGGRGKGGGSKSLEDMSAEEHFAQVRKGPPK